ncbi:beta-tubulin cofactor D family protein [Aphelenchoides avenae]|nr:beta-tubulin cofactor D family protein [Aphelenchus avenae]
MSGIAEEEADVIGCTPVTLEPAHLAEMKELISKVPSLETTAKNEANLERFQKLLSLYECDSRLLDPVLRDFVSELISFVSFPTKGEPLSTTSVYALQLLRSLTRIRGYKTVMRVMPHEVDYLEKVLCLLEYYAETARSGQRHSKADLHIVYVLLVWFSIICKNPFNLSKFDNTSGSTTTITQRIIDCLTAFQRSWVIQGEMKIVPTVLSQVLTRNEDNSSVLDPVVRECLEVVRSEDDGPAAEQTLVSRLTLLSALLKKGRRHEMRRYAEEVLAAVPSRLTSFETVNIEVRTLTVKLLQRIALVLLKPKLATWRYRCGFRSLEDNLRKREGQAPLQSSGNAVSKIAEEDEQEDVPFDQLEGIIQCMLHGVVDAYNDVRWSAAKGLGRICARLPRDAASEIIESMIATNFSIPSSSAWHGGSLALAELCHRGCLLPEQLPPVMDILCRALLFEGDDAKPVASVNVRDAACYICWAFARAYEAPVLAPYMERVAHSLVCLALFDREVNIRRAASAAFQENVGRNGACPDGIAVLTIVDFVAVALIRRCYHELCVQVAEHAAYRVPMLNHLVDMKSVHWDEKIRVLASDALLRIASFESDYCRKELLPRLVSRLRTTDITVRHGTIYALSSLMEALCLSSHIAVESLEELPTILDIVPQSFAWLRDRRVQGTTLLMKALCRFVKAVCSVRVPLSEDQLRVWHDLLDTIVLEDNAQLRNMAEAAYDVLFSYYGGKTDRLQERVRTEYFPKVQQSPSESDRIANIVPLACISKGFLGMLVSEVDRPEGQVTLTEAIVRKLIFVIHDLSTPRWAFARVAAIETMTTLLKKFVPDQFDWHSAIDSLIYACDDSTLTMQGDVGRFVRKAAVQALCTLLVERGHADVDKSRVDLAIGKILQRCCEPIDGLREDAATALIGLIRSPLSIAERATLEAVFLSDDDTKNEYADRVDWRHRSAYLRLEPLLNAPTYKHCVLKGFVLSAGSINDWTSQNAVTSITKHVKPMKEDRERMDSFVTDVLSILNEVLSAKHDPTPVLRLLKMLANDRMLATFESDPDSSSSFTQLVEVVIRLLNGKGKAKLKTACIGALGSLLNMKRDSKLGVRCWKYTISMLASPYPVLREAAVEPIFDALNALDQDEYCSEPVQRALSILTDTPWSSAEYSDQILEAKAELTSLLLPQ